MPLYQYKGLNKDGKKIANTIFGSSQEEATNSLKANGITIIELSEVQKKEYFWQKAYGGVSHKEKIIFIKYLSAILKTGLNIKKAFEILSAQIKNKHFAKVVASIKESIENGQTLNQSLRKYPNIFSEIFINMVAVGEVSGTLPATLDYLDYLLTKDYTFKQKVKGAMMYPVMVLTLVFVVSIGLVKFVIPRITKIFENFNINLPFMTQLLIDFEKFLTKYWIILIIVSIGSLIGIYALLQVRKIKKIVHKVFLKTPVIGSLIKQVQITRFTQITASLIQSGVTMVESIRIASKTLGSLVYQDYIGAGTSYIEEGGDLAGYLEKRPDLFEPVVIQMINLGQNTGTMENTLKVLAELNETESNERINSLSSLIGPLLLIVMGMLVGVIALSIISPIYQLPNLIQQGR